MPTAQAQMAIDADMDLVEINANNIPPIAKIMNYGNTNTNKKKISERVKSKTNELKRFG